METKQGREWEDERRAMSDGWSQCQHYFEVILFRGGGMGGLLATYFTSNRDRWVDTPLRSRGVKAMAT